MPSGWRPETLGELAHVNPEQLGTRTDPDYTLEYLDIAAIEQPGVMGPSRTLTFSEAPSRARRRTRAGDILVSTVRPYLRNFARIRESRSNLVASTGYTVVRPRDWVDGSFLYQHIMSDDFVEFLKPRMRGSNYPAVKSADIEEYTLSLPPLPEQRKIAAILSSVDDTIEKTQAVIGQVQVVKRGLMQKLFTRGVPGQHTQFKQTEIGEIPREWDSAPLGRRVELQPGFAFKSRDFSADGDRLLRGSNVGVGRLIWADDKTKYFPSTRRAEVKDYELQEGDIVVAMDRPFISDGFKIATVTAGDLPALLLQRVGRFRRFRDLTPGYLWQLLQSRFVKTHLQISQKGTDLPHISKSETESAICPFPTVDEQERIARRLEALDIYTTRLDQERKQCELLKAALMSVLLNGDLRVTPGTEAA